MNNEVIREAEQEVRDLEKRYEDTIESLRPTTDSWDSITRTYRREPYSILTALIIGL